MSFPDLKSDLNLQQFQRLLDPLSLAAKPRSQAIPAAVLVPLFFAGDDLMVLFIQRTYQVKTHRGQISFPGGKQDGGDPDALTTALREVEEEIGLPAAQVRILGGLGDFTTITGFWIQSFVGLIPFPTSLRPNSREVARVFAYPVRRLAEIDRWRCGPHSWQGRHLTRIYFCHFPGALIWGATARILLALLTRLPLSFEPQNIPVISP